MKAILIITSIFLIIIQGCIHKTEKDNQFSSFNDTIVLKTDKIKGAGVFSPNGGSINFFDTTEHYEYPVIFPKNISNIKIAFQYIDFKPFMYEYCKSGKWDKSEFLGYVLAKKIDTLNLPSLKDNNICIMTGQRGKDTVFIVDENNNKDFRDDSVRLYQKLDLKSNLNLIKCKYKVYNGKRIVEDSSWVNIGTKNDRLWFIVSNHLLSSFSFENQIYQIGVAAPNSTFCFDEPILALLSENGKKKDTLLLKYFIKKGEYLKLKDSYYCFNDVSNDGKYITLVKERNFKSKIGTQVGVIAPDFKCKSINGEIINSSKLKNKLLLVANITGCIPKSFEMYKKLIIANKGRINIIGINAGTKFNNGILVDVEDDENKDIYNKYRQVYSSSICFLINTEGRVIDKFEIYDWESNLSNYIGK